MTCFYSQMPADVEKAVEGGAKHWFATRDADYWRFIPIGPIRLTPEEALEDRDVLTAIHPDASVTCFQWWPEGECYDQ